MTPGIDVRKVKEVLHKTQILDLDGSLLISTLRRYEYQSVVVKSAELMDYLQTRRQRDERPAEVWLKCEKALSFYAPFLYLCGYEEMAAELQGLAHEFFFDDNKRVRDEALKQRDIALFHQTDVNALVKNTVGVAFGPDDGIVSSKSRVKSLGSYERKLTEIMGDESPTSALGDLALASAGVTEYRISDGIASRIILEDDVFTAETAAAIAVRVNVCLGLVCQVYGYEIKKWHVKGVDKADRDYVNNPKENGYMAYHLNYMLTLPDGSEVPFEVQILNKTMDKVNSHGNASHVVNYKDTSGITDDTQHLGYQDLDYLSTFEGRSLHLDRAHARVARDIYSHHSMLNPNSLAYLLTAFPKLPTSLHEVYGVNSDGNLVPRELADITVEEEDFSEVVDERLYLPPNHLSVEQFKDLIGLLDVTFYNDPDIQVAINWIQELEAADPDNFRRRDGSSSLEGHLLPTAYYAALLATASGRRWGSEQDEVHFMKSTIIAGILHDLFEDHYFAPEKRAEAIVRTERLFNTEATPDRPSSTLGTDVVELITAVTLPNIADESERRIVYTRQLIDSQRTHSRALFLKLADRIQNHTQDVIRLLHISQSPGEPMEKQAKIDKIDDYFIKTEEHLMNAFDGLKNQYPVYGYARAYLWALRSAVVRSITIDEE